MKREVQLSRRAQDAFGTLDRRIRDRIRSALDQLAREGRGDPKKLKGIRGGPALYRLRVGPHRVILELTPTEIRVTRIVRRSEGSDWL